MKYLALSLAGLWLIAVIAIIVDSVFLHVGAKIAGIRRATFGRAVKASIACSLSTLLLALIFSWVPVGGTAVGFLIGLGLTIVVLQASYSTGFGKAFLLWIFNVVAQIIAVVAGTFLLTGIFSLTG